MKEITVEELRTIQIDILSSVHDFCVKNQLRYSLTYGTLIGAIRHKGYIPWDDDIDIMMPRPDYDKFMSNFIHPSFIQTDFEKDNKCPYTYGKVYDKRTLVIDKNKNKWEYGVNIDVFPVDGLGNDYSNSVKFYNGVAFDRKVLKLKLLDNNKSRDYRKRLFLFISNIILFPFEYAYLQKRLINKMRQNTFDNSKYASDLNWGNGMRTFRKSIFEKYELVTFENREYCIISQYDEFLHRIYGDYMLLPPIEKRISTHVFSAFWR